MASKYYEWLSGQIEQHAKIEVVAQGYDHSALTRLADAAGALKNRSPGAQAFGMTLPAEGVEGAEVLVDRCLAIIEQRAPLLDDAHVGEQLGALLQRLGLKAVVPPPISPKSSHMLRVTLPVSVEDADSEKEIVDPATWRLLNGMKESAGSLVDVACIHAAVGGHNDPTKKDTAWANDGFAELVFNPKSQMLMCQLAFSLVREPSQRELEQLLQCIRTQLFDSSWVLNLEWVPPQGAPEVIVHLKQKIMSHEINPISA